MAATHLIVEIEKYSHAASTGHIDLHLEREYLIINHYSPVLCIFLTDCLFIYYSYEMLLNNQTKIKLEVGDSKSIV